LAAEKQPNEISEELDAVKAVSSQTPDARITAAENLPSKFADTEFKRSLSTWRQPL